MSSSENIIIKFKEVEEPQPTIFEPDNNDELLNYMFSNMKKKKKKDKDKEKTEIDINLNQEEQELLDEFNLRLKKKKKNNKSKDIQENEKPTAYDLPTYTYQYLLNRLYENFEDNEKPVKSKNVIKMPTIQRMGSKKTGWINFKDCCNSLNRDFCHLKTFITSELSTEGNLDGNSYLILKGIYNQKNIENILRNYVVSYVQCSICKSLETYIRKDSATRLSFLECLSCKSNRALQLITSVVKQPGKSVKFKE